MTVVGDLHGQLEDLLHILDLCGTPDPNHILIFNGEPPLRLLHRDPYTGSWRFTPNSLHCPSHTLI